MINGRVHTVWAKATNSNHLISINGDVYSLGLRKGYLKLLPNQSHKGYIRISHGDSVHRQVAKLFIPNSKEEVNHKNGIRNDNRIENLEWVTPQENSIHAHATFNRVFNNKSGGEALADRRKRQCIYTTSKYIGYRLGNLVVVGQNESTLELECICLCNGNTYIHQRKFILPTLKYKKKKGCIHCTQQRRKGLYISNDKYIELLQMKGINYNE